VTARLLIATRSPGKQREIREILADVPYEVVFPDDQGLYETPDEAYLENQPTFEGNARQKAEHFAKRSGLPTAADDSGLEVLFLGGQPGVRSKRFALPAPNQDEANNQELLRRLLGAPEARRGATYRCAVAFVPGPLGLPHLFEGRCQGRILTEPLGNSGFGYDPLFLSADLGKSLGEATGAEKHAVSHRGRAFRAFAEWLAEHPIGG